MVKKKTTKKNVETLTHDESKRKNIPTAEYQSVLQKQEQNPVRVAYERRNRDLDPQLVWRGKDEQDWSDLIVHAPPLYIQEKVHPKALIDDLLRQTKESQHEDMMLTADLFADFNGIPKGIDKTEFYKHEQNWSNRMILGDSLQVMSSLAEREGLRGKVQCIYIDPPYGIKFNSNFQWSTTSRDVKDGNTDHITREPEQVKAFRDTWRDGIHSYLTYLRDRLTVARDLLTDSGSIFVQIGDENAHRVRAVMDEIFGEENFCCQIVYTTTSTQGSNLMPIVNDNVLWAGKNIKSIKFRQLFNRKRLGEFGTTGYNHLQTADNKFIPLLTVSDLQKKFEAGGRVFASSDLTSSHYSKSEGIFQNGKIFTPKNRYWSTSTVGMYRLQKADRLWVVGDTLRYRRFLDDFDVLPISNLWSEQLSEQNKSYVVQTASKVIERCILMTTDPGDLVLDPTCGSGTTAYVSRAMGPPLDHDRYVTCSFGIGPCPYHGCSLSVLYAGRFSRRPDERSGDYPYNTLHETNTWRHSAWIRL